MMLFIHYSSVENTHLNRMQATFQLLQAKAVILKLDKVDQILQKGKKILKEGQRWKVHKVVLKILKMNQKLQVQWVDQ